MSRITDLFKKVGQYFMEHDKQGPIAIPDPQIGMEWSIIQHRAYRNPQDGTKKETLARFQIATVDDDSVGIVENYSYYRLYQRSKWDEIYAANFAGPRSAGEMTGGGKVVPLYLGIGEPVNVTRKPENVVPFLYFQEPKNCLYHSDRKVEPLTRPSY